MSSEDTDRLSMATGVTAEWREWAKQQAWLAKCEQLAEQLKRDQEASLVEKGTAAVITRTCRMMNLAERMMQERKLEAPATDALLVCLCGHSHRSAYSDYGSRERHRHDALTMGSLLALCDHLGITDKDADELQQLAREQQWQGSRHFDYESTLCAAEEVGSHISSLLLTLRHGMSDWEAGDPAEGMIDALFALIDALPKSTTKQAGGAT
jgi:hypothetical protein